MSFFKLTASALVLASSIFGLSLYANATSPDPSYIPQPHRNSVIGAPLFAIMNGGNVCDRNAVCREGDPNGSGSANISLIRTHRGVNLCFGLLVDGIDTPIEAHIHHGRSGFVGPDVATLTPVPAFGNSGTSSGCVRVDSATAAAIAADPTAYYIDVITQNFLRGAIRGQLF